MLAYNDQAHRQPERNETMKITDKQVEELGDLFYSISDKKGHHALTPELCDDLIGEVEKILSNSSGCSVQPMVMHDRLINLLCGYESKTGKKPTSIYLGRSEYKKLSQEYDEICLVPYEEANYKSRTMFRGINVYVVDHETHLNCA